MDLESFSEKYLAGKKDLFPQTLLLEAFDLVKSSQVRIEFARRNERGHYYIVSGIVRENRDHLCKIKVKENVQVQSSCDCPHWKLDTHCPHVLALLIQYHINEDKGENQFNFQHGVKAKDFGTIVDRSSLLLGAPQNSSFASLQYELINKKVINLPAEKKFVGVLEIHLTKVLGFSQSDEDYNDIYRGQEQFVTPTFSYLSTEGERTQQISLFGHTQLFDWTTGDLFELPNDLKDVLRIIRYKYKSITENVNLMSVDDYIKLTKKVRDKAIAEIWIDAEAFSKIDTIVPNIKVSLSPSQKRKTFLEFRIEFLDDEGINLSPPEALQLFAFDNGLLKSFSRKKDAYEFLMVLLNDWETGRNEVGNYTRNSKERDQLNNTINNLSEVSSIVNYETNVKKICKYDASLIKKIFNFCFHNFGDTFFRFSTFSYEERALVFEVGAQQLLGGVSDFYELVSPFGVRIFYNKNELNQWRSRVHFERKSFQMNWFDLNLKLTKKDLQVIAKAETDKGLAMTDEGMVLLSKDQKDLLRFLKKYTHYEATDQNLEDDELINFQIPFHKARIFELFELKRLGLDGALTQEELDLCHNLMNLNEIPNYEPPILKNGTPRQYQIDGYRWMRFLYDNQFGACLADDMGLGKTLQTIMFLQSIELNIKRVMIVCPVSILINWEQEFKKFSELDVEIYHGGGREFPINKKIILTSYGIMKKEVHDKEGTLSDLEFDIIILDEVQHLKNIRSLGAMAARNLKSRFNICLTGTPVENDLSEFYNILDLAVPGIWGDLNFIRTSSAKKGRLVAKKTARPFILRRTKNQVLQELPEKVENHVFLEFSEDEKDHYQNRLKQIKQKIEEVIPRKKYGEILKGLLELRQLCLWQRKQANHTKVEFVLENIEQILEEGHQAIIFSQFTTYLDVIQREVEKRTWRYSRIDGSQSIKKRQSQVDAFQNNKNPIFLISLKAGGVGLNLTAASYVFLMDPWWNPAVEAQAIDRAHRIGQKNKLTVYRPIIKDTVEEKVLKLQQYKRELFNDLMAENDDQYYTGKLTKDDFVFLFSDE